MSYLSDETLLKRATHAGRNLTVLAVLASLVAAAFASLGFVVPGSPKIFPVLAGSVSLLAAAYWVLSVAGRRGNPNSVGIVIVVLVVQLFLTLISAGIAAAHNGTAYKPEFPNILVSTLILLALYKSRKVLLELQERGLWDQAFPSAQSSGNLCAIGGILMVTGFLAVNISSGYLGSKVGQARTFERTQANTFVQMIQQDEQAFMKSMHALSQDPSKVRLQETLDKIEFLESKLESIKKQSADARQLQGILDTYGGAVRQWKAAVLLLKQPNFDSEHFTAAIKLGDRLRADACQSFDRQYGRNAESTDTYQSATLLP